MNSTLTQITTYVYLDPSAQELIFSTAEGIHKSRLEPLSSRLLAYMAENRGELLTRERLIEVLWDGNEGVGNRALTKNIYKLRKAFEAQGEASPIETIPKKGYRIKGSLPVLNTPKKTTIPWLVAAGVAVGFILLKLLVPGLFHMMGHRLMH